MNAGLLAWIVVASLIAAAFWRYRYVSRRDGARYRRCRCSACQTGLPYDGPPLTDREKRVLGWIAADARIKVPERSYGERWTP